MNENYYDEAFRGYANECITEERERDEEKTANFED